MRLILYTGKGGVGKTTISAITGVKASLLNHRTLVISTDIAHSLSDVFDIELGSEPVPVAKNLWAQEINVLEEIKTHWNEVHDYLTNLLVTKGLDDVVAEEISVLPGMEELCGLLQINKQYKSDLFDCIIVDCAPTGESLRFLSLLDTVDWYVEKLFDISSKVTGIFQPIVKTALVLPNEKIFEAVEGLFGQLRELRKLLANVENTSLRIVLNPQKMVIKEAQRSFTYFNLFNYNTDGIIINKIQTHPLSEEGNEIQEKYLKEIKNSFYPVPLFELPVYEKEIIGYEDLKKVGDELFKKHDPTEIFFKENVREIIKENGNYLLKLKLPFLGKEKFSLFKKGEELIIEIANQRCAIILPHFLSLLNPANGEWVNGKLVITFI